MAGLRKDTLDRSSSFYLQGEKNDRRTLRVATLVAVLIHAVLFTVVFPEFVEDVAEAKGTQVFVVRAVPFKPRPPDPERAKLRERARRVPIPDPTPDDPEPLATALPDPPALEVPSDFVAIGDLLPPPPPAIVGPVEFSSEMVRPVRISGVDPRYTEIARRARLEGVVILRAVISRDGVVSDIETVKPLGFGLEDVAVAAVKDWRFEPATLDGKPIDVIYRVTVKFSLR